jgi:hypothetical protein
MSIVRDLLEYYKLPTVIKNHQDDFRSANEVINGYDLKRYYDKDKDFDGTPLPGQPYVQNIYHYTSDAQFWGITEIRYNDDFEVTRTKITYNGGKSEITKTVSWGSPAEEYPVSTFTQTHDVNVSWPPTVWPSTGWPEGAFGGAGGMKWVRISAHVNPGKHNYGYLCNTSSAYIAVQLPLNAEEGYTVAMADEAGTFHLASKGGVFTAYGGVTIMGLAEHLWLNERYQGCQLVCDGSNDWRIVWSTPLVANVSTP